MSRRAWTALAVRTYRTLWESAGGSNNALSLCIRWRLGRDLLEQGASSSIARSLAHYQSFSSLSPSIYSAAVRDRGLLSPALPLNCSANRALQTSAYYLQQIQPKVVPPGGTPLPPLTVTPPVVVGPEDQPTRLTEAATEAEECDEALEDLAETRRRVSALRRPPPGHTPWG
jgi:hypothetical protein